MKVNLWCDDKIIQEIECDEETEEIEQSVVECDGRLIALLEDFKKKQIEQIEQYEQIIKKLDEVSEIIKGSSK